MPNWKTYGNKGPTPWNFTKSQAEGKYNEGNVITNLGEPVWSLEDNGLGGIPITTIHHPNCGMWNGLDSPGVVYPPIVPTLENGPALNLQFVAWTPNIGGSLGRFVGFYVNYSPQQNSFLYYSDNGGVTWTQVFGTSWDSLHYVLSLSFCNDLFTAIWWIGSIRGSAISSDGVTWTFGPNMAGYIDLIGYNAYHDVYFGSGSPGGGWAYAHNSSDCLNWVFGQSLYAFLSFPGVASLGSKSYMFNRNYSVAYSTAFLPATLPVLGYVWSSMVYPVEATVPVPGSFASQVASNGNVIVYNNCYFDGSVWTANGNIFAKIDWNKETNIFASHGNLSVPQFVALSYDGIAWTTIIVPTRDFYDIAIGNDRCVLARGGHGILIVHLF
jgi:hypothetical protein